MQRVWNFGLLALGLVTIGITIYNYIQDSKARKKWDALAASVNPKK